MGYPTDPIRGEIYNDERWWDYYVSAWRRFPRILIPKDPEDAIVPFCINCQTFDSGTGVFEWHKPTGVSSDSRVVFRGVGGGGSGGVVKLPSSSSDNFAAVGGEGGEFVQQYFTLASLDEIEQVTIGAGGSAVTISESGPQNANGNSGQSTSFQGVTCAGGSGGSSSVGSSPSISSSGQSSEIMSNNPPEGSDGISAPGNVSSAGASVSPGDDKTFSGGAGGSIGYNDGNLYAERGGSSKYLGSGAFGLIKLSSDMPPFPNIQDGDPYGGGGAAAGLIYENDMSISSGAGGRGWAQIIVVSPPFDPLTTY